jgi:hypothetical protein
MTENGGDKDVIPMIGKGTDRDVTPMMGKGGDRDVKRRRQRYTVIRLLNKDYGLDTQKPSSLFS